MFDDIGSLLFDLMSDFIFQYVCRTSKARKTGKSFLEISSLFNRGSNENDLKNASFDEETGHQPKS